MKVYISGPITGLPLETVYNNFTNVEVQLLEQGYEVVNPLNNGLPTNATWNEHMRSDLKLLLDCDAIYMLKGYQNSKGAMIECDLAIKLGYYIIIRTEKLKFRPITVEEREKLRIPVYDYIL